MLAAAVGLLLVAFWRYRVAANRAVRFPLAHLFLTTPAWVGTWPLRTLNVLRFSTLVLLTLAIGRPQWVDVHSKVSVDGVDIMLALDVSGSMQLFDDPRNPKWRIHVARDEAARFVERRENDAIGVVVFGADALTLLPLTHDKKLLIQTIKSLEIDKIIGSDGTYLATGISSALNRLRLSSAKSKIIVLLTDGSPSPDESISVEQAVNLAKEMGVKIYCIGVGDPANSFAFVGNGIARISDAGVNDKLLWQIAEGTGGKYYRARNLNELEKVYTTIDQLERDERDVEQCHNYQEAFGFLWWVMALFFLLEVMARYWWRGVI